MIELYTWKTSNGRKATIMLEECELEYNVHPINIGQDDQFTPEYIAINPNSKIPSIIDTDGPNGEPYTVIESGAETARARTSRTRTSRRTSTS